MIRKSIIYTFILILFSGCGRINRACANFEGHSYECVNGVQYVQFPSGASPLYSIDGKLVSCRFE